MNQKVLRDSSATTPPNHSRPTYRNFFQPRVRWQYTGITTAFNKNLLKRINKELEGNFNLDAHPSAYI